MSARRKVGVLVSGSGSNLQALMDACAQPDFPAEIALVISNKPNAYGLERARRAGIATCVIEHQHFVNREAFDDALHDALVSAEVELVCLAGFMRLLTPAFVERWHNCLINIHPSLLPSFKGTHTHAQALQTGVKFSGCTVHFVRTEMDVGPIIAQAVVPVFQEDTAETLAARVLQQEHQIYPQALRQLAEGALHVEGERVVVRENNGFRGN